MSTSNHTPGPWYFKKNINLHDQGLVIAEKTGASIAVTYDSRDAMLIAAAPEMITALQEIEYQLFDHPDRDVGNSKVHYAWHKARAAIAAAIYR